RAHIVKVTPSGADITAARCHAASLYVPLNVTVGSGSGRKGKARRSTVILSPTRSWSFWRRTAAG
ncbi:MAG: hypothetical protein HW385_1251, partial [candidate division NC10 bacterium]|nr:hypothetical protein [candidate division NC10 bacterium]